MDHTDSRTLKFYNANASNYSHRKPRLKDVEALDYFIQQMPLASEICDLGCGNGWASDVLLQNGHSVTSIDGSTGLAAEAHRLYGIEVMVQNFDDFAFQSKFDGLWSCWALHHVSRDFFPRLLKRLSNGIKSGGLLYFSVKGGGQEGRDEVERLYSYYSWAELSHIITDTIDGEIVNHLSWHVENVDTDKDLRHQVFVRIN